MACAERTGPGPDRLGLKFYLAWGEPGWWVRDGGAKGPRPDPLGFPPDLGGWGEEGQGPGPDPFGFRPFRPGLGGGGGPRVLGRAGLVFNTLKNHDSDGDINIILSRKRKMEPGFQFFHIPVPKNVFWGRWTLGVQKITNLCTILTIFYKFALIRDTS